MKGKVAALVGPEEVVVKEFEVPEPEPGAVLMKIRRAQVCGSEVHIFHFHHPLIRECVLGHEFIGEIAALGEGMETDFAGNPVQIGDRVIAPYFLTCRRCPACLRGDFNLCQRAYSFWSNPPEEEPHFTGAFATHYYVHPDQYLYKVPDNVSDKVVAGANCGLSQVLFGLHQIGLAAGDSLVVQGAGGLGLYAAGDRQGHGSSGHHDRGHPGAHRARQAVRGREYSGHAGASDGRGAGRAGSIADRWLRCGRGSGGDGRSRCVPRSPAARAARREGGRDRERKPRQGARGLARPGLITRKNLRVQGFVRYQPWYLHRALRFLERKHRDHPFDELSDREYALEDAGKAIELEEARKVARPAIVPA